jgi:hypothetical protein
MGRQPVRFPKLIGSPLMHYPAASCGVSRTARNEASFGEYHLKRYTLLQFNFILDTQENVFYDPGN